MAAGKWHVTKHRIDLVHGFAGSSIDTIDFRRVTDMHFHRSVFQMCCNRGTITFHSANDSMPVLELTTFGTQDLYHKIKDVRPTGCALCWMLSCFCQP